MDEMTSRERIDAAVALQEVDRVPVVLLMSFFCARQQGVPMDKFITDGDLARDVLEKSYYDLECDTTAYGSGFTEFTMSLAAPAPLNVPGRELPVDQQYQIAEREVMEFEDYDFLIENGWEAFFTKVFPRIRPHIPVEDVPRLLQEAGGQAVRDMLKWEAQSIQAFVGGAGTSAFSTLSYLRSINEFILDLYRYPEKVEAALDAVMDYQVASTIGAMDAMRQVTKWGGRTVLLADPRPTLLSPKQFERFAWPCIKRFVMAHVEAGNTPCLHFDANWTPFLEHFLELPRGKVILELDGATDIFKAKEVLKDHMCIMGDVPAPLLKLGTVDEVVDYVKKLIDVVGEGGGFILSNGCEVPIDAKFENVKAVVDTAKTYYPHRKAVSTH